MATPSPGYAITVRVDSPATVDATGDLAAAVARARGSLTALDVAESHADRLVVDVTCNAPEVDPLEAAPHAAVVATGRSDFPNQINNVLAFPGLFRGMLDAQAREITPEVLLAAARAIADAVAPSELNASYVVPSVFDPHVAPAVATAVREAAGAAGPAAYEPVPHRPAPTRNDRE